MTLLKSRALSLLAPFLLWGCVTFVSPTSTNATYDVKKILGHFVVVFDDSVSKKSRLTVTSGRWQGAGCIYPVDAEDAIKASFMHMFKQVFEQVTEQSKLPSETAIREMGLNGAVLVTMTVFSPQRQLSSGSCGSYFPQGGPIPTLASTNISFRVEIQGTHGNLFAETAFGSSTEHGCGCGSGTAEPLGKSITSATESALRELAVKISRAPRLGGSTAK